MSFKKLKSQFRLINPHITSKIDNLHQTLPTQEGIHDDKAATNALGTSSFHEPIISLGFVLLKKEREMKKHYRFLGTIFLFNEPVSCNWEAETYAISKAQALNNLTYRAKKYMGYLPTTRIRISGDLIEV